MSGEQAIRLGQSWLLSAALSLLLIGALWDAATRLGLCDAVPLPVLISAAGFMMGVAIVGSHESARP